MQLALRDLASKMAREALSISSSAPVESNAKAITATVLAEYAKQLDQQHLLLFGANGLDLT